MQVHHHFRELEGLELGRGCLVSDSGWDKAMRQQKSTYHFERDDWTLQHIEKAVRKQRNLKDGIGCVRCTPRTILEQED